MRSQADQNVEINEDTLLLLKKWEGFEERVKKNQVKKKQIEEKIKKMEDDLNRLKKEGSVLLKQIKDSTAVRESMARKASVATREVRETR